MNRSIVSTSIAAIAAIVVLVWIATRAEPRHECPTRVRIVERCLPCVSVAPHIAPDVKP